MLDLSNPSPLKPTIAQIWSLMNLAYAEHEIISDYTTAAFMWFEGGCAPLCCCCLFVWGLLALADGYTCPKRAAGCWVCWKRLVVVVEWRPCEAA